MYAQSGTYLGRGRSLSGKDGGLPKKKKILPPILKIFDNSNY